MSSGVLVFGDVQCVDPSVWPVVKRSELLLRS